MLYERNTFRPGLTAKQRRPRCQEENPLHKNRSFPPRTYGVRQGSLKPAIPGLHRATFRSFKLGPLSRSLLACVQHTQFSGRGLHIAGTWRTRPPPLFWHHPASSAARRGTHAALSFSRSVGAMPVQMRMVTKIQVLCLRERQLRVSPSPQLM